VRPLAFVRGDVVVLDKRWYLDVNRFARETPWGHGFMTAYDQRVLSPVGAGLLVLALIVVAGWWSARREPEHMTAVVWSVVGAGIALGLSRVLAEVFARPRPYQAIEHVEVLVRSTGRAFPDDHAALAGAVVCGLLLARRWRLAPLALLAGLLLLFARVYVGADYPSDVAAGAGLGAALELAGWPLVSWVMTPVVSGVAGSQRGRPTAAGQSRGRPARRRALRRTAPRLPDARAMDALRVATEAARQAASASGTRPPGAPVPGAPVGTSSIRTIRQPERTSPKDA